MKYGLVPAHGYALLVAPRMGRVDCNLSGVPILKGGSKSRPAWGAWIEIPWSIGGLGVFDVAPRMGCVD